LPSFLPVIRKNNSAEDRKLKKGRDTRSGVCLPLSRILRCSFQTIPYPAEKFNQHPAQRECRNFGETPKKNPGMEFTSER
ncbi:MAG: hypothetical protein ACLUIR_06675, partial [Faecalibacterium prausnitzii]